MVINFLLISFPMRAFLIQYLNLSILFAQTPFQKLLYLMIIFHFEIFCFKHFEKTLDHF